VSDSEFDSGTSYGIQTNPAAGGFVDLLKIINTWACTNAHGIILNPSNTGLTRRVEIVNCTLSNNVAGAGLHIGGSTVTNVLMQGGSAAQNTNGIHVIAGSTKFNIDNVRLGPSGEFAANTGYGILLDAGGTDDFSITNCDVQTNGTGGISDGATGVNRVIKDNRGYVTKNTGTSAVTVGNASVAVTHGLVTTPAAQDIQLIETSSRTVSGVTAVWISAIGATTFQVNTNTNVGGSNLTFGWKATCKGA
jgi:hypothetical protein